MTSRRQSISAGDRFPTKGAVHEHVRRILVLERLCTRFHLIAMQLRSRPAGREPLLMQDEGDVGDLLHALLLLEHDDVRPETWTPTYASGSSRTDFVIRLERIAIEARMAHEGFSVEQLAEQLSEDVRKYREHPDCDTLVCFVYDPDRRIPRPREVEKRLSADCKGLTLRVFIAPKGL